MQFFVILIPLTLLAIVLRIVYLPIGLLWKILINAVCGFACLYLLNALSVFTGVRFPINLVSGLIAGFLGVPGICFLLVIRWIL